jgi:DNA-binding transcriptional MerR regulator
MMETTSAAATSMNAGGYRVPEVCKVVGITYRQLDYWARTELVTPSIREAGGSGTQRLYSFQDLVLLRLIKSLLDTGVSLQQIRKAIEYLRENEGNELTGITLMSDGRSIYACSTPGEVMDVLQKGQGVFGIALDRVRDELEGSLRGMAKQRTKAGPTQLSLAATGGR